MPYALDSVKTVVEPVYVTETSKNEATPSPSKDKGSDKKEKKKDSTAKQQMATPQPVAARQPPKPKQYILHRDIFFLRESKKREKETRRNEYQFNNNVKVQAHTCTSLRLDSVPLNK